MIFSPVANLSNTPAFVYPIPTNGLQFYIDAGNTTSYPGFGTKWKDTIYGRIGTLINGPTFSSTDGGSIVFDKTNDYVGNWPFNETFTECTIIAWVRREDALNAYTGIVFSRFGAGSACGMSVGPNPNNYLGYTWNDASNTYSWSSGLLIPLNEWVMLTIAVGATSTDIYVNLTGATNTVTATSNVIDALNIGRDPFGPTDRVWGGKIAQSYIYNRKLPSPEITIIFNSTKSRYGL